MNPLRACSSKSVAGVTEIYRVGGAQGVAALAFGAGPIAAVDVIAGPGNAYVAEAKAPGVRVCGDRQCCRAFRNSRGG